MNAEPLPEAEPIHKKPSLKRSVQLWKRGGRSGMT